MTSDSRERPRLRVPGFGSAGIISNHHTEPNRTEPLAGTRLETESSPPRNGAPGRGGLAVSVGEHVKHTTRFRSVRFGSVRRHRCCFNRKQDEPKRGCLFPHPSFSDRLLCFLVTGPEETNDEPRETERACPRAERFRSRVRSAADLTLKSNVGTLQLLRDVKAPSEI